MLNNLKNKILDAKNELNYLEKQYAKLHNDLEEEKTNYEYIEEAQIFLQTVAKKTQSKLSFHISDFVSNALETIWGEEAYTFKLDFIEKRNKTEVEMFLVDDNGIIGLKDLNSLRTGGGILDIIAFALRISLWSLQKNKEKLIILDQPFTNLDSEHLPLANLLLKEVNEKLGIQFLIINHNPLLNEGNDIYEVYKEDGVSKISKQEVRS